MSPRLPNRGSPDRRMSPDHHLSPEPRLTAVTPSSHHLNSESRVVASWAQPGESLFPQY